MSLSNLYASGLKKKGNTHDLLVCSGAFPASSRPVTRHKNIHIKAFRVLDNNLTPRLCSSHSLSATSPKNHSMIHQKHFQRAAAQSFQLPSFISDVSARHISVGWKPLHRATLVEKHVQAQTSLYGNISITRKRGQQPHRHSPLLWKNTVRPATA